MSLLILGMSKVYRISLDAQGYAKGSGRYYGVGLPVYACWHGDGLYECRAPTLAKARAELRKQILLNVSLGDLERMCDAYERNAY